MEKVESKVAEPKEGASTRLDDSTDENDEDTPLTAIFDAMNNAPATGEAKEQEEDLDDTLLSTAMKRKFLNLLSLHFIFTRSSSFIVVGE